MPEGRPPSCCDWLTLRRVGASEAVSGEVAAPEMAVSERRGLARRSPAEWGLRLLLLLLLGGCSGRIHRLALTVSPVARRSGAGSAVSLPRKPLVWSGLVLPPPLPTRDGAVRRPPFPGPEWSRPRSPPQTSRGVAWPTTLGLCPAPRGWDLTSRDYPPSLIL